jgi:hypothetical protein
MNQSTKAVSKVPFLTAGDCSLSIEELATRRSQVPATT